MTAKLEQQYQRYVYQYELMEAKYGAENMADTKLTKSEFETQMIRVRNTSHANIKAAKEKFEKLLIIWFTKHCKWGDYISPFCILLIKYGKIS